jgi:hypothetical protein
MLNTDQKRKFNILQERLIHAETSAEINYYSSKINDLIAKTKKQKNQSVTSRFTKEQLKQYKEYRQELVDANYISEVRYYKVKLHQLIDEVLKKGAYKVEYNLNSDQIAAYYDYRYNMISTTPFKSKYRKKTAEVIPEDILLKIDSSINY